MRDVIEVARRGKPAVALLTEAFEPQGMFVATAAGMPKVPQVVLPHPVAGRGDDFLRSLAEEIAPKIVAILTQEAPGAAGD